MNFNKHEKYHNVPSPTVLENWCVGRGSFKRSIGWLPKGKGRFGRGRYNSSRPYSLSYLLIVAATVILPQAALANFLKRQHQAGQW